MWIKELCGENFSGMNFHDTYGSNEIRISGRNKSGKSTRIKAFFWLLSGYTAANQPMNSNLYDNRVELSKDTPEARVWAKVVLDNGEEYMIERIARAKFQRRRGSDIYEKSASDEYLYKIDNIDRSASDFREWISENIVDEDLLRFCLDGSFFINLLDEDKRKARNLIGKVVGEITPEEMKGDYHDIDELLDKYSPDEVDARAANLSKSISKRLDEIPALVANKTTELSEIEQTDFNANDKEIARLEEMREQYNRQLLDLTERMRPVLEAKARAERDRQAKVDFYKKSEEIYKKGWIEKDNSLVAEISRVESENEAKRRHIDELRRMNATDEKTIAEYDASIDELRSEKAGLEKQVFNGSNTCPVCGHELSPDDMEKARLDFIRKQREDIERIVSRANEIKGWISNIKKHIDKRNEEIGQTTLADVETLKQKLRDLRTKDILPFPETEQGRALQADIDAVVIPSTEMPDDGDIKKSIEKINTGLIPLYETRGLKSRGDKLRKDIETLRAEQKEKGAELAVYELQRQLVKQYKQEQMEILSHKVNDGLKASRIECWSQQKSGDVVPDLVIKDANGVAYSTTNGANRSSTAIDIQRFFCDKLGVNLPTFIDESSIFSEENLPKLEGVQTFYLFCSNTSLKIECK